MKHETQAKAWLHQNTPKYYFIESHAFLSSQLMSAG